MKLKKPILNKGRLILRPFRLADAKDLIAIKSTTRTMGKINTLPKAKLGIKNMNSKKHGYYLSVVLKEEKKVIGYVELCHLNWWEYKAGEICYAINKKYTGKGYATEASTILIDYCFKKLKFHKMYADTDPKNLASQKVLKKLGFKLEGVIREKHYSNGKWEDELDYGLLKKEWNR
ncbi:GNAT family N-acetyltransferase [Nanoarchaeota archaeon]